LNFKYGKRQIDYEIIYIDRKSMEISVHPDKKVVVKAPINTNEETIKSRIQKRAAWILKQIKYFEQFNPRTPTKQYINGESHLYLGKSYRLKILPGKSRNVKLKTGLFLVQTTDKENRETVKSLMTAWYREKSYFQFTELLNNRWVVKFSKENEKPKIVVKKMKTRWGSLSDKGILTLNSELIKAPKECIDYVIVHELCHLIYKDHGSKFFKLLESILPEWEKLKHKLEMALI